MTGTHAKVGDFKIVDAVAADAALLADLGARTFRDTFEVDNTADDLRNHLDSSFSPDIQRAEIGDSGIDTLLVRDPSGVAMAFAQLRKGDAMDGVPAGSIELWRFYVDKAWHGRGIAHDLMNAVKARARRRGAVAMWLGVWERNPRAQAFYGKHGFRKVGKKVFVVGTDPQTDDVLLCHLA